MKIYKNGEVHEVTKGAYKEYFEPLGWKKSPENAAENENFSDEKNFGNDETDDLSLENPDENLDEDTDEEVEKEIDYLLQKPVEEFTKAEMKAFVAAHGLDVKGMTKNQVRQAIAGYIQNNQ